MTPRATLQQAWRFLPLPLPLLDRKLLWFGKTGRVVAINGAANTKNSHAPWGGSSDTSLFPMYSTWPVDLQPG